MKKNGIFALLLAAAMMTGCTSAVDATVDGTLEAKPQQTAEAAEQTTTAATAATTTTTAATEATTSTTTTTEAIEAVEAVEATEVTTVATTTTAATEATTVATTTAATTEATTTATTTEATTTATTTEATTTTAIEQPVEVVETKYVALTFDDGPNTTTTPAVLDMLEKYDITASFFLIGTNINDGSAEVVKRAYDMGCEINNHSKSHPYMNEMTVDEIIEQFTYTDDLIYEITGERSKFFRPPYIAVSQDMLDNIDVPFISGIGCNDWDDKVTVERRHAMIMRQVKDGSIILLHDADGNSKTVEALDLIIPDMLEQGYKFVTMSELFEVYGVEISGDDEKIYSNVHQTTMY